MEFSKDGLASVAVDLLVFTIDEGKLKILTIRRQYPPFAGLRALPGVFVGAEETLDQAALRGLREETGLDSIYFEQLYTFGAPDRDPRRRVISVSYLALVEAERLRGFAPGLRTTGAELSEVWELLAAEDVAFDHRDIVAYGRQRLAGKVEYSPIAFSLVPEEFTLPQLQRVYEILLDRPLYKANFRKKIAPMVEETDRSTSGDAHRPSRLYRLRSGA